MQYSSKNPHVVRSVFMSDFHIGYKGFDAHAALNFIQSHEFQYLYLLGDIFDGWKLEKRWYCNQDIIDFIDAVIDKKKQGVKVMLTPGNHDEHFRDFHTLPIRYFYSKKWGVKIEDDFIHTAADGRRYLALHGDQFDMNVLKNTSKFFDRAYQWFVDESVLPPRRATIDNERWSLGKAIAKNGQKLLNRFTEAAAVRSVRDGLDGVIYGHSHVAMLKRRNGNMIANCGSWTLKEDRAMAHTAIVETVEGLFSLEHWPMMRREKKHPNLKNIPINEISSKHHETKEILRMVHKLCCKPLPKFNINPIHQSL